MSQSPTFIPSPLYVTPTELPDKRGLREVRSRATHTLLAYIGDEGIYLFDRRAGTQHLISWESGPCSILENKDSA